MKTTEKFVASECTVAVVGAGYMSREHIRAFKDIPGVKVLGIHSRTAARAAALAGEFGIANVCESIDELYAKTRADLVVISVPELMTRVVSCACFAYPWTALIEKPAGYNLADAEFIAAAADAKSRKAFVALNRRYFASTQAVVEDLAHLPGPRLIKVQDQEGPAAALKAGQPQLVVENWMYANSIHIIDYFTFLGRGKITGVMPVIEWNSQRPGYVAARISFDSGDIGLYEAIWDGPGPWSVSVNTPDKRWELRPLEQAAFQIAGERSLTTVEKNNFDVRFKPGLRRQAELAVIAATGGITSLPTLHDGLASMRLTSAIYKNH